MGIVYKYDKNTVLSKLYSVNLQILYLWVCNLPIVGAARGAYHRKTSVFDGGAIFDIATKKHGVEAVAGVNKHLFAAAPNKSVQKSAISGGDGQRES